MLFLAFGPLLADAGFVKFLPKKMKNVQHLGRWKALEKGSFRLTRAAQHALVCWRGEVVLGALRRLSRFSKFKAMRSFYYGMLKTLVKRTCLFDDAFYLELNPDVAASRHSALKHFIAYGDKEGRWPMPLFDPNYYRSRTEDETSAVNSLIHYAWIGRYRRTSPSTWFDLRHYLSLYRDVARSGIDPLLHYMQIGGIQGRSPNPQFDAAFYLRSNPDVKDAGLNPLLHYVRFGRHEGRPTRENSAEITSSIFVGNEFMSHVRDEDESWELIDQRRIVFTGPPLVDVIVPVYRNAALTRRCIASALTAKCGTPFQITVIDDCSPEPALSADLHNMAELGWIRLLINENNRGFVASANLGMCQHPERDVVLLNSDTEVYDGWLDLLRNCAYSRPNVASVTPLSNNATICSYPRFLHDNPYPLEIAYPEIARLAAAVNVGCAVETPTAVGFCMYLRREVIDTIGVFNEKLFGKGYGEENDWCQRAIRAGYKNLIAADVYVRHFGAASFQGEKGKRIAHAMKILARIHPTYHEQVRNFIDSDPLLDLRRKLDWARLSGQARSQNALMVCHNRGGGAEKHLQEDAARLSAAGKGIFFMRPDKDKPGHVRIQHRTCRQLLNLGSHPMAETSLLADVLSKLKITEVHSHGLVDFSAEAPSSLKAVCELIGAAMHVDIHDYKVICPRLNLVDNDGYYCGEPDVAGCNRCLLENGNDFGVIDIEKWRAEHLEVLRSAKHISVPNQDVAARIQRYYPDLKPEVVPHEADSLTSERQKAAIPFLSKSSSLRVKIVTLGAINKSKGYQVLMDCAKDSRKRRLPLDFIVMGYTMNDALLKKCGVKITGRYDDLHASELLESLDPHIVWLPSTWPETYSYTLSIAQRKSYPITAFDLGAIAQRCRERGDGFLLPLEMAKRPSELNDTFLSFACNSKILEAPC